MERGKAWRGYPALSKPLTIMGVERRWFLLSATLGLAMWNAINSIVTGGLIFAVLYGVGFWAWKQDPNMLEIFREVSARFGPAPWTLLIRPRPLRSGNLIQVGSSALDGALDSDRPAVG